MASYSGTFSCGHEGKVNVIGPHKTREWKIEKAFSGLCPECYEKYLQEQRELQNKEAAEKAKEMELPQLKGTEKQIDWANTLRQKLIELFSKINKEELKRAKFMSEELKELKLSDIKIIEDYILQNKVEASYYINNRYNNAFQFIIMEMKEALKTDEEKIEELQEKEVKLEATVFPENAVTNVAAEIIVKDDKVSVIFDKNEDFRQIVKSLGYKWEGAWERKITELTGAAADRAAELGNKLLNAGFPVCILDRKIRNDAVNGIYEPECDRWIMLRGKGEYEGRLVIKWWGQDDKLYNTSRKLPGSRWDSGTIVRVEHYKEVEEFANLYSFKFTEKARESIEKYKKATENIETVAPVAVTEEKPTDGLEEILNSGSDILDDLKD